MLKYTITVLFLLISCSVNEDADFKKSSFKKIDKIMSGSSCNDKCIWSTYAVNMNIQEGKYECSSGKCVCVKENNAYMLCEPAGFLNNLENNDKSKNDILSIPYYNQYENEFYKSSTCQNTSIAMALSYFEYIISPDYIFSEWGKDIAQSPMGLNSVYSHYSKKSKIKTNTSASPSDLLKSLSNGNIAIVHGYFTSSGHVIVVRGFYNNRYHVNDPAGKWLGCFMCGYSSNNNGITSYSKEAFESAVFTSDGSTYLPGWIHIISKL